MGIKPCFLQRRWKKTASAMNDARTKSWIARPARRRLWPRFCFDSGKVTFERSEAPQPLKDSTMAERKPKVVRTRPGFRGE